MKYTRNITLFWLTTDSLPFVNVFLFFCPENNLNTIGWNLIKLHSMVKHNETSCSGKEQYLFLSLLPNNCHFLLFSCSKIIFKKPLDGISYQGRVRGVLVTFSDSFSLIYAPMLISKLIFERAMNNLNESIIFCISNISGKCTCRNNLIPYSLFLIQM